MKTNKGQKKTVTKQKHENVFVKVEKFFKNNSSNLINAFLLSNKKILNQTGKIYEYLNNVSLDAQKKEKAITKNLDKLQILLNEFTRKERKKINEIAKYKFINIDDAEQIVLYSDIKTIIKDELVLNWLLFVGDPIYEEKDTSYIDEEVSKSKKNKEIFDSTFLTAHSLADVIINNTIIKLDQLTKLYSKDQIILNYVIDGKHSVKALSSFKTTYTDFFEFMYSKCLPEKQIYLEYDKKCDYFKLRDLVDPETELTLYNKSNYLNIHDERFNNIHLERYKNYYDKRKLEKK